MKPSGTPDSPWIRPSDPFLEQYLEMAELWIYRPGTVIFLQGELSPGLLYLQKGRVKICVYGEDGREKILAFHEAPTTLGEVSTIDGIASFSTCVALDQCYVHLFRKPVLAELLESHPELSLPLVECVARKYRTLERQVQDLTFLDAAPRIANLLAKLVVDYGVLTTAGEKLSIPVTHQELADVAGTSRVTVTTILNRLEEEGIIQKRRKTIFIRDKSRLFDLCRQNPRARSSE